MKTIKILLLLLSFVAVGYSVVTVGSAATDRSSTAGSGNTWIEKKVPASASGRLTSVTTYVNSTLSNAAIGVFYISSGSVYKCRSAYTVGSLGTGSQTINGLDLTCVSGDYIGIYYSSGAIDRDAGTSGDSYTLTGNLCKVDTTGTFAASTRLLSLNGTGPLTYTITSDTVGLGSVVFKTSHILVDSGSVVKAQEIPGFESVFDKWTGDTTGKTLSNDTISIIATSNKNIVANFTPANLIGRHYVSPIGTGTWWQSLNPDSACNELMMNARASAGDTVYFDPSGNYNISLSKLNFSGIDSVLFYIPNASDSIYFLVTSSGVSIGGGAFGDSVLLTGSDGGIADIIAYNGIFDHWSKSTVEIAIYDSTDDTTTAVVNDTGYIIAKTATSGVITAEFGIDTFALAYTLAGDVAALSVKYPNGDSLAPYNTSLTCTLVVAASHYATGSWGTVGAGRWPVTVLMTQDSTRTATGYALPTRTIDTVYSPYAPITTNAVSLVYDSASPAPKCTLFCTPVSGYAAVWQGGIVYYPSRDTLIINVTKDSTITSNGYIRPAILSVTSHVRRATDWDYARRLDTVTVKFSTNIYDSTAACTLWVDRIMSLRMPITRWFNTAGTDSLWAVVPNTTPLNYYYRMRLKNRYGILNDEPSAHTIFVIGQVR